MPDAILVVDQARAGNGNGFAAFDAWGFVRGLGCFMHVSVGGGRNAGQFAWKFV